MCTLPHDISSSFKKVMTDLLTGSVPIHVQNIQFNICHVIVHLAWVLAGICWIFKSQPKFLLFPWVGGVGVVTNDLHMVGNSRAGKEPVFYRQLISA